MKTKILFFAVVLLFCLPKTTNAQVNTQDSLALIALFNSTNGGNWTNTWDTTQPISTWYGVKDYIVNNRITRIYLNNNNLSGALPPVIGDIDSLTYIDLRENNISGSLPVEIGNLTSLSYLSLDNNSFTGKLPYEIGNLTKLHELFLDHNYFTDTLPVSIGNLTNLVQLILDNNIFSGPIPTSLGNLTNLEVFYINNNFFTNIPSSVSQFSCHYYNLSNNPYLDSLPQEMFLNFPLIGLGTFYMDNCNFSNLPNPFPSAAISLTINSNRLTFGDIEPILAVPHQYNILSVSPQDSICNALDTTIHTGDTIVLNTITDGSSNNYTWKKNGVIINGNNLPNLTISNATLADAGIYMCEVTNTVVTGLTLYRRSIILHVDSSTISSATAVSENIRIYYDKETSIIKFIGSGTADEIKIYDTSGRIITEMKNVNLPYEMSFSQNGSFITKVVINGKINVYKLL